MSNNSKTIPGGYYVKARKIQESEINYASPCTRELWDYCIRMANHKAVKYMGHLIERGQFFCQIEQIIDGLKWKIGWRFKRYTRTAMKASLQYLKKRNMIRTTKVTHGMVVTVCNYDTYQNPKNYEESNEDLVVQPRSMSRKSTTPPNSNKNEKKEEERIINNAKFSNWRSEFVQYQNLLRSAREELMADKTWVKRQMDIYPGVDVRGSLNKALHTYWGTEETWKKMAVQKKGNVRVKQWLSKNFDKSLEFFDNTDLW